MSAVPKEIYFGADRAERKRIARQLAGIRDDPDRAALEAFTKREPAVPVELLACGVCGRPTPSCRCTDADGKPLDWKALS
jgi:hypothetical protein